MGGWLTKYCSSYLEVEHFLQKRLQRRRPRRHEDVVVEGDRLTLEAMKQLLVARDANQGLCPLYQALGALKQAFTTVLVVPITLILAFLGPKLKRNIKNGQALDVGQEIRILKRKPRFDQPHVELVEL